MKDDENPSQRTETNDHCAKKKRQNVTVDFRHSVIFPLVMMTDELLRTFESRVEIRQYHDNQQDNKTDKTGNIGNLTDSNQDRCGMRPDCQLDLIKIR